MFVCLRNVTRSAKYPFKAHLILISERNLWQNSTICQIQRSVHIEFHLVSVKDKFIQPCTPKFRSFKSLSWLCTEVECNTTPNKLPKLPPGLFSLNDISPPKPASTPVRDDLNISPASTNENPPKKEPDNKKLTLWQRTKKEILHYYHGFRLLGLEIRIATGICFRLLRGHTLARRERKQLVRTVADIIRLVPFAVFIIVPFMEFLLPVYLKFFPFMLPSTFKEKTSEADKVRQRLKAKLEMTRFLQETLHHTTGAALQRSGSPTVDEFQEFLKKVQESGQPATTEDITRFSKLFEDQVTLESLEMKQLKMLCQLLSLPTIGPSNLLRFQIWMRVRQLKAEDRLIAKEGLDAIPIWELQTLCQERGMRSVGLTEDRLRSQLQQWLTLHLEKNVPVTLLLFSRALHVTKTALEDLPLKEAIAQLPPSVSEQAANLVLESTPYTEVDPRAKMELLRKEQAGIKAARAQRAQELAALKSSTQAEAKQEAFSPEQLVDKAPVIKESSKEELQVLESQVDQPPLKTIEGPAVLEPDSAVQTSHSSVPSPIGKADSGERSVTDTVPPTVGKAEAVASASLKPHDTTREEDTEISVDDLNQIESAISESSNALNEEALHGLKEEVAETTKRSKQDEAALISVDSTVDKRTSKAAARLAARVGRMIGEMDTMIENLKDERQQLIKDIELREVHAKHAAEASEQSKMLDAIHADQQRVIDINELLLSLRRIQKVPDDTKWQKILQVLDEDHDGKIELQHVLSVVELLGTENVKLSSKDVKRVLEMIDNEQLAESIQSDDSDENFYNSPTVDGSGEGSSVPGNSQTKQTAKSLVNDPSPLPPITNGHSSSPPQKPLHTENK